jgi:hypothetical protein
VIIYPYATQSSPTPVGTTLRHVITVSK